MSRYRFNRSERACEICGVSNDRVFNKHHIRPRTDPGCTDLASNLAHICANCHMQVHAGQVIIEGVFATSAGPKLFWHRAGEPYCVRPGVFLQPDGTAIIVEEE